MFGWMLTLSTHLSGCVGAHAVCEPPGGDEQQGTQTHPEEQTRGSGASDHGGGGTGGLQAREQ